MGGGPRSTSGSVMAVLRHAGAAWTAQQIVASGAHVSADHAGIAGNGAVVVTWESYDAVCKKYGCVLSSFVLHASRQNAGTVSWVDSGALLGPDRALHAARVTLDSAGGAMLGCAEQFRPLHLRHAGQLRWRLDPVQNRSKPSGFDDC